MNGGLSVVGGFVKDSNKARFSNDVPGKILKSLQIAIAKNSKIFSINTYKNNKFPGLMKKAEITPVFKNLITPRKAITV